jgi:phosphoribosylformylglycinamidine (FGAM) synthase-like enzyme
MSDPNPSTSQPSHESRAEGFRLDGIPDTRDPIANLLTLLATLSPNRGNQNPAGPARPEGRVDRPPGNSDTAGAATDPGIPSDGAPQPEVAMASAFMDEGDALLLLGEIVDLADPLQGLGGSAFLKHVHGLRDGNPPPVDPVSAGLVQSTLAGLIQTGAVKSAQACESGGLAMALARGCHGSKRDPHGSLVWLGATVDLAGAGHAAPIANPTSAAGQEPAPEAGRLPEPTEAGGATGTPLTLGPRLDALLFGENPARVVISCALTDATCLVERARLLGVPARRLGTVGGPELKLKTGVGEFAAPVLELHALSD